MAFLKIDTLELGATYNYTPYLKNYDKKIRMASNKMVTEKKNSKWVLSVVYKYLTDEQRIALYTALENIPDGGLYIEFYNNKGQLTTGYFTVIDIPAPKIGRFNGTVPDIWTEVGFTLEEV